MNKTNDASFGAEVSNATKTSRTWRWRAALAGALAAAICVAAYLAFRASDRLPVITRERFAAAEKQWQQRGPKSYVIEVEVRGPQAAVYRVEMKNGELAAATRNGDPLPPGRTRGIWSVPGMFSTIELDLANAAGAPPPEPGVPHIQVTPLGQFDAQYGYPARYRRIEWGSTMEASWEVTLFEPR